MEDRIRTAIQESLRLHENIFVLIPEIKTAAEMMSGCIASGNKIMFAGNGGSAADAQHLAAELVNKFQKDRRPLAGMALTTDTSILTSIGNDYSFDEVFAKQVRAVGRTGDVFLGISTSGNSSNIIRAFEEARHMGISTIGLTGRGGRMHEIADCIIAVPSDLTPRIQEVHILIGHILCGIIEDAAGSNI